MAKLIVEAFETEAAGTYYTPSRKGGVPTGKLYSCYSNLRNSLASVGLIARETRNFALSSVQVATDQFVEPLKDAHEGLNALELDNFEHFADVRSVCTETSKLRDKLL